MEALNKGMGIPLFKGVSYYCSNYMPYGSVLLLAQYCLHELAAYKYRQFKSMDGV